MRPIWKGHISFGLVNVPATLYPAEQRSDLSLHMIDTKDSSRVRYQRVNADTGEEVPWDRIVKGFEYDDGSYVLLDKDELQDAAPEATQTVEIESFVDLDDIDLVYFDKPYYLEPGKKGEKGYVLLRDVLAESGKAAIAKVVIRTRQYVAAMVPRDRALVLVLLRYQQELRSTDRLDLPGDADDVGVTAQERKMARTLVDSMESDWNPGDYHDEYREALMAAIERKIDTGEMQRPPEADEPEPAGATSNLMDALKRSVAHHDEAERSTRKPKRKRTKSSSKKSSSSSKSKSS